MLKGNWHWWTWVFCLHWCRRDLRDSNFTFLAFTFLKAESMVKLSESDLAIWKWLSDNLKSPLLQQILPHWNLQLQLDLKSRDASCNTPIPTWHGAHVVATCQYYSSRFKQRGSPPLKHNLAKPRARNNMLLNCHCVCSHQNSWIFTLSKAKSQKPFHACKSQAFPQENFHY